MRRDGVTPLLLTLTLTPTPTPTATPTLTLTLTPTLTPTPTPTLSLSLSLALTLTRSRFSFSPVQVCFGSDCPLLALAAAGDAIEIELSGGGQELHLKDVELRASVAHHGQSTLLEKPHSSQWLGTTASSTDARLLSRFSVRRTVVTDPLIRF